MSLFAQSDAKSEPWHGPSAPESAAASLAGNVGRTLSPLRRGRSAARKAAHAPTARLHVRLIRRFVLSITLTAAKTWQEKVLKWEHKHEKAPDPFRFRPVRSNSRSSRPVPSSSQCGRCGAGIGSRGLQWQRLLKRGHERSWGDVTPTRSSGRRFNDNAVRCGQRFHSPMIAPSSGLRG
jgi:hypothetical protein